MVHIDPTRHVGSWFESTGEVQLVRDIWQGASLVRIRGGRFSQHRAVQVFNVASAATPGGFTAGIFDGFSYECQSEDKNQVNSSQKTNSPKYLNKVRVEIPMADFQENFRDFLSRSGLVQAQYRNHKLPRMATPNTWLAEKTIFHVPILRFKLLVFHGFPGIS